jgi:hypothetical protein
MAANRREEDGGAVLRQLIVGVVLTYYACVHLMYVLENALSVNTAVVEPTNVVAFASALALVGAVGAFSRSAALLHSGVVLFVAFAGLSFAATIKEMAAVYQCSVSCTAAEYLLNSTPCMWMDVGRLLLKLFHLCFQLLMVTLAFLVVKHIESDIGQKPLATTATKTPQSSKGADHDSNLFV